nr:hypothetical protein [Nanoarchaeum sp.]
MPKIGEKKINKLKEEILALLYEHPINPLFTSEIAEEIIRDEEFTLRILKDLHKSGLINEIKTNQKGREFLARRKWSLKPSVYSQYKQLINH